MWFDFKALRAPGLRSACAVVCGVAGAGLMAPLQAGAEEQLDPLFVTAARVPQALSRTLADVTVIDREVIERQVAGSVADVLRTVPGVQITRNGDAASTTSVMIRGSNTRHVLVLVDGVPVGSQSSGGATWEALPLAWVDHIEVVRGPASVAWGSDAMGGVVQIFTRKGQGAIGVEAGMGLSDQGLVNGDVSLTGGQGAWDYAVGVAGEANRGFNSRANTVPGTVADDRDGHRSNSSHLKLGWQASAAQRLQLSYSGMHVNNKYDASTSSKVDDQALKDSTQAAFNWSAQWLPSWHTVTTLGQSTDAYETRSSYAYHTATRMQNASVLNQWTQGAHGVRVVLERREDRLLNSDLPVLSGGDRGSQADNAVGLGYDFKTSRGGVSLTWRRDDNDRFGSHDTGALAGDLVLAPGHRLRASIGTAFRAPTLYQLYSTYGDPNLKPETSLTRELAYTGEIGLVTLGVTGYHTTFEDLIDFGALGPCLDTYYGCYRNTASARINGVTFSAETTLSGVRLTGSVDLLNPSDTASHKWLARRARQEGKLRAEWAWLGWDLGAQAQLTGRRYDDAANTKQLGGYALFGVDASRKLTPNWSTVLRVSNLSNHDYQTALNYNSEPRTVFVGLRWTPSR